MGRIILGIVVGYIAMAVWIQATYFLAQGAMGDGMSASWMITNLVLSFVGAYIGGSLALRLGRERGTGAVRGLTILVLVFGLGSALAQQLTGVLDLDQPAWYNFIIPFIGVAGVMLGGRRRSSE